jgi:hypothetical protein
MSYVLEMFITMELRSLRMAFDSPVLRYGTDQLPFGASNVEEYGDASVWFRAALSQTERRGRHPRVCGIETIHTEEEVHSASGLAS